MQQRIRLECGHIRKFVRLQPYYYCKTCRLQRQAIELILEEEASKPGGLQASKA
jgi:hypothetical protein